MGQDSWTRVNTGGKTIRDTRFEVNGLPEKTQFEFRIIAINRAGESDSSLPSDVVFTEDKPSRPILDLSQLRDITVRAGKTITFTIPYTSGGLRPTVNAFNGTNAIYEDDRTSIIIENDKIKFTTTNSKRLDAGKN